MWRVFSEIMRHEVQISLDSLTLSEPLAMPNESICIKFVTHGVMPRITRCDGRTFTIGPLSDVLEFVA